MTTAIRLTELQSLLLSHASRSERQAFEPLPETLRDQGARIRPCMRSLVKRGLAEVRTIKGDDEKPTVVEVLATPAGLEAIGCETSPRPLSPGATSEEILASEQVRADPQAASTSPAPEPASDTEKLGSRTQQLLQLLAQDEGITLAALAETTGSLPHSVRAALTGLRKKGHAIESTKVDGEHRYSVAPGA